MAGSAGTVQNQNGVGDAALRVAHSVAERGVMQAHLRQRFARLELEILDGKIAFSCSRPLGDLAVRWQA